MQPPFATARVIKRQSRRQTPDAFLWQWLGEGVSARAQGVNRTFQNVQIVAPTPTFAEAVKTARPDWVITETGQTLCAGAFDAIIMLGLPAITNDVPQLLTDARNVLAEGGLFLCGMYGGSTYAELRTALLQAESHISQGAATRVAPMIDPGTAANLMQRAGFALPVVDHETTHASYGDLMHLVGDIRAANAHAVLSDARPMPRALPGAVDAAYRAQFCDARGRFVATLTGVYLSGWRS